MEHGHPLARLGAFVAAARSHGHATRLVLRNTGRFGVVHLYFQHGHLVRVEGHRRTPLGSLADIATWQYGIIRQDNLPPEEPGGSVDARLDTALDDAVRELEIRGVVQTAARITSTPVGTAARTRAAGEAGSSARAEQPRSFHTGDLPPLREVRRDTAPFAAAGVGEDDRLTDPQWQLLALVLRQVVEKASQTMSPQLVEVFFQQALLLAARSHPAFRGIELDDSGWLKAASESTLGRPSVYQMAEAVAALLTDFESRCAHVIGAEQAQRIIKVAAAPFRVSLAQLGLDISD